MGGHCPRNLLLFADAFLDLGEVARHRLAEFKTLRGQYPPYATGEVAYSDWPSIVPSG